MDSSITLSPRRGPAGGFVLLLAVLALVAAGKAVLADTLDPDCFWHLRVGQELANLGWPKPLVDNLSFASMRTPWTPYSWLAEIGMKRLWDVGGYRAAVAMQAGMEAAFIVLLGLGALESSRIDGTPRYLASAVAAAAGGMLSLAYLSFRPVTAALTGLALIAWLLLRDRRLEQKSKAVWLVVPLTAILINIHFFALGVPLWTGALCVGDAIESARGITRRRVARGAALTMLCALACGMTPLLRGVLASVTAYATRDVMVRGGIIAEMRPFYAGTMGHISAGLVALLGLFVLVKWIDSRRKQTPPRFALGEIFWLAGSAVALFRLGRLSPVFAIIAAPALAATLPRLSDRLLSRRPVIALLAAVALLMMWQVERGFPARWVPISQWLDRQGADVPPAYPCAAVDFVDRSIVPATGRVICEFTWGGYLEWRLNPRFQAMMDGRTQLFSADFWRQTQLSGPEACKRYLTGTRADAAILGERRSVFAPLLAELGWTVVYEDAFAKVMVPPQNHGAISDGK